MVETRHQQRLRLQAEQRARDAASAKKVFEVPELLEDILLEADMKTVLLAQRVDNMFKATIDGSVKIQRMLWFLPDTPSSGKPQVNPMAMTGPRSTRLYSYLVATEDPPGSGTIFIEVGYYLDRLQSFGSSFRKMQMVRLPKSVKVIRWIVELLARRGGLGARNENYHVIEDAPFEGAATVGQVVDSLLECAQGRWSHRFDKQGNLLPWDDTNNRPLSGVNGN